MKRMMNQFVPILGVTVAVFLACSSPSSPAGGNQSPGSPGNPTGSTSIPGIPTGIVATNTTSQATISWTAVPGATSYNVYRGLAAGVTKVTGFNFFGASSPFVQTGLSNGTDYRYVVTAVNGGGESQPSSAVHG